MYKNRSKVDQQAHLILAKTKDDSEVHFIPLI